MSHVTEGLLHAHLDGALGPPEAAAWAEAEAHLAACEDCRRRLEEAAELRRAAGALLAAAAPPAAAGPGFEALAREAERRRAPSGAAGRWWRSPARLAWAASLALAVGAGWIGHDLLVDEGVDVARPAASADAVLQDAAPEERRREAADEREVPPAGEVPATGEASAARAPTPLPDAAKADDLLEAQGEPGGELDREQAFAARATDPAGSHRCYAAQRPERQERVAAAENLGAAADADADAKADAVADAAGADGTLDASGLTRLRLAPGGTAEARLGDEPLVGFWEAAGGDSLDVRLTGGAGWAEMRLAEVDGALRGTGGRVRLTAVDCPMD